jgi:archaellum biogenesis protein FlaJ (TadC family)
MFTGIITGVLLVGGAITYFMLTENNKSIIAVFLLGCAGVFSVYFHRKTEKLYPFADFDEPLHELSKKYWALHIAFGLILFILGVLMIVLWIQEPVDVVILGMSIFLFIIGLWTLLDVYFLNKFIVSYKERLERRNEIDDIGDSSTL